MDLQKSAYDGKKKAKAEIGSFEYEPDSEKLKKIGQNLWAYDPIVHVSHSFPHDF